jgi:hypothetical protein
MNYTDIIPIETPVVARSYVSGVVVGRLLGGSAGTVALAYWRWLRQWEGVGKGVGVGGEGSVYDLIASEMSVSQVGPYTIEITILQQADIMVISEAAYARLAQPDA